MLLTSILLIVNGKQFIRIYLSTWVLSYNLIELEWFRLLLKSIKLLIFFLFRPQINIFALYKLIKILDTVLAVDPFPRIKNFLSLKLNFCFSSNFLNP